MMWRQNLRNTKYFFLHPVKMAVLSTGNPDLPSADLYWDNDLSVTLQGTGICESVVVQGSTHTNVRGCSISMLGPIFPYNNQPVSAAFYMCE